MDRQQGNQFFLFLFLFFHVIFYQTGFFIIPPFCQIQDFARRRGHHQGSSFFIHIFF